MSSSRRRTRHSTTSATTIVGGGSTSKRCSVTTKGCMDETETETTASVMSEDDYSDHDSGSEYEEEVDLEDDLDDIQLELLEFDRKLRRRSRVGTMRRSSAPTLLSPAIRALLNAEPKQRTASMPLLSVAALQERIEQANANNGYFQSPELDASAAPSEAAAAAAPESIQRPHEYLTQVILEGLPISFLCDDEFFEPVTMERVAAHSVVVSSAIRAGNVQSLQELHQDGVPLGGCNPQGESMIHLACRMNHVEVVRFLLQDAHVNVRVRDDSGRTALHDAAWTTQPNFDLIRLLLQEAPELLFVQDKRQFSALRYIPRSAWGEWRLFMQENKAWLQRIVTESTATKANHKLDEAQQRVRNLMKRMSV